MRNIILTTMLAFLPFVAVDASAHAFLDHAEPRVGSTVQTAPRELLLAFTQDLEPAFSAAEVRDANGNRVDRGKAKVSGSLMHLGLKSLAPGSYKVQWRALSVDTHTTEGTFSFRVGQ
jgi:methionine-rich copper-binding protein CopC